MPGRTYAFGSPMRRVLAASAASIVLALLAPGFPATAAVAPEAVEVLEDLGFMTAEEYQAAYPAYAEEVIAVDSPAEPTPSAQGKTPDNATQKLKITGMQGKGTRENEAAGNGTGLQAVDPGGGGGATAWWTVLWQYQDLIKNRVFIRYGNSGFGFDHFASKHDLHNRKVFERIKATKPKIVSVAALSTRFSLLIPGTATSRKESSLSRSRQLSQTTGTGGPRMGRTSV